MIQRIDGFLTAHSASFDAVGAALPTEALRPVRLPNGRALIAVAFYQKRAATAGSGASSHVSPPYAEVPITAVVTRRRQARVSRLTMAPRGVDFRATVCGNVPGESVVVRGAAPAARAILYLHGGGYCQGSPATHRTLTGNLALRCGAHVFAPDYRLAPEQPFPAAVEDAVAAYSGLLAEGFAPGATTIAGDSAGGGLAVATALSLRELGLPRPAALVLFSPWVDLSGSALEPSAPADIVTKSFVDECSHAYLAGHPATDPLASPIEADLHGLPPALIQVGGDELLLSDSCRLRAAFAAADVDAQLQVFPRRWHVFQLLAGPLADANRALAAVGELVEARTSSSPAFDSRAPHSSSCPAQGRGRPDQRRGAEPI